MKDACGRQPQVSHESIPQAGHDSMTGSLSTIFLHPSWFSVTLYLSYGTVWLSPVDGVLLHDCRLPLACVFCLSNDEGHRGWWQHSVAVCLK